MGTKFLTGILLAISITGVHATPIGIERGLVPIEPGVSLQLARQRAQTLRNIRYRIHFQVPSSIKDALKAEETIYFDCLDNSLPLQIDFKAGPGQVSEVTVNGQQIDCLPEKEHLVIASRYLHKGHDSVQIRFTPGDRPLNRNPDYLYTLLVPDKARSLFPCFDQPDLKAIFILTLTLPQDWKAVANGPLKDSSAARAGGERGDAQKGGAERAGADGAEGMTGGMKTYRFLPSNKISTYLFAFAAGKFAAASRNMSGRVMHGYYRETDSNKIRVSLDSLFRIQQQAIDFLQTYTTIPYPFLKFDFVAIPDFQFGGMEHPGAIQYQSSTLFLDESATAEQLNSRSNLLSHETAHMWFGDLVTMRWFNDVWMKEVFANFMADKIGNITRPGGDFELKFLTAHFPAAYNTDRTAGANPIRQTLDNLQDAGSLYGNIIYNKAPIVMQQLELLMGPVPFRNGLREYLKTYAYRNASWPDLIHILGKYTSVDLEAWNKVWVGETGRPQVTYQWQTNGNTVSRLVLTQKGEDGSDRIWPQVIGLSFVYADHMDQYLVNLNARSVTVPAVSGKPKPLYILFNSTGKGYGLFPIDTVGISRVSALPDPVMRASAYINQYESMLDGLTLTPHELLRLDQQYLGNESKELNMGILLGQISSVFWHFIPAASRIAFAPDLEQTLWTTMLKATQPNEKKLLFLAYASIALSRDAQDTVYKIWSKKQPPEGVRLSEEDYTSLAAGLALRVYPGYEQVLAEQGKRIQNPDRRLRFQYLQPALSADPAVRDSLFATFKDKKNREKESWVLSALGYLHHPLRTDVSEKYLAPSLDWLEDIQRTGDVFFPERWLQVSFGNYQSPVVADMVTRFLKDHPAYNPKLREKILQASDNLMRAGKLLGR